MSKQQKISQINQNINHILNTNLPLFPIYQSAGLKQHIESRHPDCIEYLNKTKEIIEKPDYIGVKSDNALEFIKILDKNIMVAVKLDASKDYFYVASIYDVTNDKIQRRLRKGLIKKLSIDKF